MRKRPSDDSLSDPIHSFESPHDTYQKPRLKRRGEKDSTNLNESSSEDSMRRNLIMSEVKESNNIEQPIANKFHSNYASSKMSFSQYQ